MKVKDLFNVLLGAQDVRIFSTGKISIWEGEFKDIPHEYFDKLIDTMYSVPVVGLSSFIVVYIDN
jgi:hypothetical protein